MALLSSIITSISASTIFTAPLTQSLLASLGLSGATVGGQIFALGVLSLFAMAAVIGLYIMVYLGCQQWHKHHATQPATPHTDEARKLVAQVNSRVEKHLTNIDESLSTAKALFTEIESNLDNQAHAAQQKALAQAQAGGYKIAFTLDIAELKQQRQQPGSEDTQLFFDYPHATPAQKAAYQRYCDTPILLSSIAPSVWQAIAHRLGNDSGFAVLLKQETTDSTKAAFKANNILELLYHLPYLPTRFPINEIPLTPSQLGKEACVWGIDNTGVFFIHYTTSVEDSDEKAWLSIIAVTPSNTNIPQWSIQAEHEAETELRNHADISSEDWSNLAEHLQEIALGFYLPRTDASNTDNEQQILVSKLKV